MDIEQIYFPKNKAYMHTQAECAICHTVSKFDWMLIYKEYENVGKYLDATLFNSVSSQEYDEATGNYSRITGITCYGYDSHYDKRGKY